MKYGMAVCIVLALFVSACDSQGPVAPELASEAQLKAQDSFSKIPPELATLTLCKVYTTGGPDVTFTVVATDFTTGSPPPGFPQDVVVADGACVEVAFPDPGRFNVFVTENVPAGYQFVSYTEDFVLVNGTTGSLGPFTENPNTMAINVSGDRGVTLEYTNEPVPGGGGDEGCTPGYWKNHVEDWPAAYAPTDIFSDIFGGSYDVDLLTALKAGGGGIKRAGRHGTAALLSAAHAGVDYAYSIAEVIALVQNGDIDALEAANEAGCPL